MPEALSSKPEPYRHEWRPGLPYDRVFTGWSYPPKDYAKWGELAYQWAKHCVERYGRGGSRVTGIGKPGTRRTSATGAATPEEFHKLHDYAIDGVRRALPTARVGGPDVGGQRRASGREIFSSIACAGPITPPARSARRSISFPFTPKVRPTFVDDHVRMGIANQLRDIDDGFAIIASFPELKNTPIVIGESDPEGCAACQGPQLGYRNGTMYSSYTAASFARKSRPRRSTRREFRQARSRGRSNLKISRYFAGFRQLASGGLPLPVLNVFRMFSRMYGDRVTAESDAAMPLQEIMRLGVREKPDVGALASNDGKKLCVMVWHYHDDDVKGDDAGVELALAGLPANVSEAKLTHYRVDEYHSDAYDAWRRMGSPIAPNERQYRQLQEASNLAKLADAPATVRVEQGMATLKFTLPRQGVSLVLVEW